MATLPNYYKIKNYIAYEGQTEFDINFIYKNKEDIYFTINKSLNDKILKKYSVSRDTNWINNFQYTAKLILDKPLKKGDKVTIYRQMQVKQIVDYLTNSLVTVDMLRNETENIFLILQDLFENFLDLTDKVKLEELIENEIIPELPFATEFQKGIVRYSTEEDVYEGKSNESVLTPLKLKKKLDKDIIPLLNKDKTKYLEIGDIVRVHPSKARRDPTLISPLDGRSIEIGDYKLNELNGFETKTGTVKITEKGLISYKLIKESGDLICLNDKYLFCSKTMYEYNSYSNLTKINTIGELKEAKYCFYNKDNTFLHICNTDNSFSNINLNDYSITHSDIYPHEDILFFAVIGEIFYSIVKENNQYILKTSLNNIDWLFEYDLTILGEKISPFIGKCQINGTNNFLNNDIYISSISNKELCKINVITKEYVVLFDTSFFENETGIFNYNQLCPKFIKNKGFFHIGITNSTSKILYTEDGFIWNIVDCYCNVEFIDNYDSYYNLSFEVINEEGLLMLSFKTINSNNTFVFSSNSFFENNNFDLITNTDGNNLFYFSYYNDKSIGFTEENKRINIFELSNINENESIIYQTVLDRKIGDNFITLPNLSDTDDNQGRYVWAIKGK